MFNRSVSIIGIGQTRYGDAGTDEELKDLSLQDLTQWACADAMEDAGVNPRDIGKLILGQVCSPNYTSNTIAPSNGLGEFLGMKGKPCVYHNEVCGTTPCVFDEAVTAVASGEYDIVMCVDSDDVRYMSHPWMPSCYRLPSSEHAKYYHKLGVGSGNDSAYVAWSGGYFAQSEAPARHYQREHNLTYEEMDDAYAGMAITQRHHASKNPNTYMSTPWEDIAARRGFSDAREYLKSDRYNPKYTEYLRPSCSGPMGMGATAIILCATDLAGKYRQKPIEVMGNALVCSSSLTPNIEGLGCEQAVAQVYEKTGYGPEDIEYLQTTDMDLNDCLYSAEACGYLPKGKGWEYFRDGKTAFDAEKPMNTDGGHLSYGHCFSASQMASLIEPVRQMRGQSYNQMPTPPKVALARCQGGLQVTLATIFRTVEGVNDEPKPGENRYVSKPYVRMFYDALDEGKFLGSRCPECGHVEFPLYSICNNCGHIGNEIIELSGGATVKEVYMLSSTYTPAIMAAYAPIFGCEAQLDEGPEFMCCIFGIKPEEYDEYRENVPFRAQLVAMPDSQGFGYNSFALSVNGAVPTPKTGVGLITDDAGFREGSLSQGR